MPVVAAPAEECPESVFAALGAVAKTPDRAASLGYGFRSRGGFAGPYPSGALARDLRKLCGDDAPLPRAFGVMVFGESAGEQAFLRDIHALAALTCAKDRRPQGRDPGGEPGARFTRAWSSARLTAGSAPPRSPLLLGELRSRLHTKLLDRPLARGGWTLVLRDLAVGIAVEFRLRWQGRSRI